MYEDKHSLSWVIYCSTPKLCILWLVIAAYNNIKCFIKYHKLSLSILSLASVTHTHLKKNIFWKGEIDKWSVYLAVLDLSKIKCCFIFAVFIIPFSVVWTFHNFCCYYVVIECGLPNFYVAFYFLLAGCYYTVCVCFFLSKHNTSWHGWHECKKRKWCDV